MSVIDDFTNYYEELLEGHYDCVDRIVVNAYFEYAQSAGGFRSWWRTWMGSDETLDRAHLERMAGRFKRRLEAYAKKNKIPFLLCEAGERKHEKAEPYVPQDPDLRSVPDPGWTRPSAGVGSRTQPQESDHEFVSQEEMALRQSLPYSLDGSILLSMVEYTYPAPSHIMMTWRSSALDASERTFRLMLVHTSRQASVL